VRTFRGELDGVILESALGWALSRGKTVCTMPEKYNWEHIGAETMKFYERVMRAPHGGRAAAEVVAMDDGTTR